MKKVIAILSMLVLGFTFSINAQDSVKEKKADSGYIFTEVIKLPATAVKNQYRSGTCWSWDTVASP